MLHLRLKRLLKKIEVIDQESPGIVFSELTDAPCITALHPSKDKELRDKIECLVKSFCSISKKSYREVTQRLIRKHACFGDAEESYVSTTMFAKSIGVQAKPNLFDYLIETGLLNKVNNKYLLTPKGESYGAYRYKEDGNWWVVWDKELLYPVAKKLLEQTTDNDNQLYKSTYDYAQEFGIDVQTINYYLSSLGLLTGDRELGLTPKGKGYGAIKPNGKGKNDIAWNTAALAPLIEPLRNKFHESVNPVSFLSTTKYGNIVGVDAKTCLFDFLQDQGLLERIEGSYTLTEKGEVFGDYFHKDNGESWVVWYKPLLDILVLPIKEKLLGDMEFGLFHMTHINNLKNILANGLYSHSQMTDYFDISNQDVNVRRARQESFHKLKLHDYVPLYFNPRNAMLYQRQKDFSSELVILEINKKIILNDYTLFSKGNAARSDCKIEASLLKVKDFPWDSIYANTWSNNGEVNEAQKTIMMSECLIRDHIPPEYILHVHCRNDEMNQTVRYQTGSQLKSCRTSPEWFF